MQQKSRYFNYTLLQVTHFNLYYLKKKDERFVKSISIVKDKNHIFKDFLCPFKKTFLGKLCMQFYAHQKQNTQIYGIALNKLFFLFHNKKILIFQICMYPVKKKKNEAQTLLNSSLAKMQGLSVGYLIFQNWVFQISLKNLLIITKQKVGS